LKNTLAELKEFRKKINSLVVAEKEIDSIDALENWLREFEKLKSELINECENYDDNLKEQEQEVIYQAKSQLKHSNLIEMVFSIGAFALFKKRPNFIKYIWEYKQPPDTTAIHTGHDIIPNSLEELIKFYFRKGSFERRIPFWEDHHSSEIYFQQYFLLILARILSQRYGESDIEKVAEEPTLPDLPVTRLSGIKHSVDELISISSKLPKYEIWLLS